MLKRKTMQLLKALMGLQLLPHGYVNCKILSIDENSHVSKI